MRLRIPNRLEDVFLALEQADVALRRSRVAEACCADVRLVLEELLVNTVRHGYPDGRDGYIDIDLEIRSDAVRLDLCDDAQAFDPMLHEPPDLPGNLADRAIGGLGLHIARSIADDLTYQRHERHNQVIVHFLITPSDEPAP